MNKRGFWTGAAFGAATTLILTNKPLREKLTGRLSGGSSSLKASSEKLKQSAADAASNVKQNVTTGKDIFKDTVQAGTQGFIDSVEKHKAPAQPLESEPVAEEAATPDDSLAASDNMAKETDDSLAASDNMAKETDDSLTASDSVAEETEQRESADIITIPSPEPRDE